jgi:hypothetical protein
MGVVRLAVMGLYGVGFASGSSSVMPHQRGWFAFIYMSDMVLNDVYFRASVNQGGRQV